jgi:Cu/Ag efflux protein CusF
MFRLAVSLIVAVAVLGTVASAVAYAEEVKCEGMITKIEGEKVTVKTTTDEHHLTVLPSTKIMVEGKPAKSSDLKVGQKVKCVAEKQGDKVTCTSIETMR